jgi:hypothetical protein
MTALDEAVVPDAPNPYVVRVDDGESGWEVLILDAEGVAVWSRACSGEQEARTLASTIEQHTRWLSPGKFRQYYRLAEGG